MSETYAVKVNDVFDFEINTSELNALDSVQVASGTYHVLHQNVPFRAEISSENFLEKSYEVKISNNTYTVRIQDQLDKLIAEMGFEAGAGKQVNSLVAPMPGLILEIAILVGQQVSKGELLLILGAMKMENSFVSPRDGIIKTIAVLTGDAVDKGQLLIEFE